MTTPSTAAGRALFGRLWAVSEYDEASRIIATVEHDIVAIEQEAARATEQRIAAAVREVWQGGHYETPGQVVRAVLALIEGGSDAPRS